MRKLRLIWKFTDAAEENSYFSNTDVEKAMECVKFEPIDRYIQYSLIHNQKYDPLYSLFTFPMKFSALKTFVLNRNLVNAVLF